MKKLFFISTLLLFAASLSAQVSDDDFFGGYEDDLFGGEDMIIENPVSESASKSESDLNHGVLFQTGAVKIGGSFDLGLTTLTPFGNGSSFSDSLTGTQLIPSANAELTIDSRPSENLRLYAKGGINYPYVTKSNSMLMGLPGQGGILVSSDDSFRNLFYVKELFSDFHFGDNIALRFGKQTVTWGVGYFFSPADVINLSAIDPEDPTAQVEGPLCLRSQIVFPGTQNAVWAYLIPDNSFSFTQEGLGINARDTALAAKADIVIGSYELGIGGWYKYNHAPRAMFTFSGSLFGKVSIFGESVVAFGQDNQWKNDLEKEVFFQETLGLMYYWKTPKITMAAQYYYNGNKEDKFHFLQGTGVPADITKHGNNIAGMVNFEKVFVNTLSANIYGVSYLEGEMMIASAMLKYSPFKEFSVSAGPYLMWNDFSKDPFISAKIDLQLGAGKF